MLEDTPESIYEAKELLEQMRSIFTGDELDIVVGNVTIKEVADKQGVLSESIKRRIRRKKNRVREELL